jgi:hypothetical protein
MSAQLATYIVLFLLFYHGSRPFSSFNTLASFEHVFVFKSNKNLKESSPNSIHIKAEFMIDKYLELHETLHNLTISEFVVYYDCNNHDFKKRRTPLII